MRRLAPVLLLALLAPLCGSRTASAAACPNEARRLEQGVSALADCRAYELVTPSNLIAQSSSIARAAPDGDAFTFYATDPGPEAATSSFFQLSRRGPLGWSSQSVGPQSAPGALFEDECEENVFFAPDLGRFVLEHGWYEAGEPAHCKRAEEDVVPGEPVPFRNLILRDVGAGTARLVNAPPEAAEPANAKFEDAADDFSRIYFSEEAALLPGLPSGFGSYVWAEGSLLPLTVLPDGTAVVGELVEGINHLGGSAGSGFAPLTGAVSADGGRAFFYAGAGLYLRLHADRPQSPVAGGCTDPALACSVQVDASRGPGPSGGGVFWRATADGSKVFFTDTSRLTPDSGAAAGKPDLFEYDAGTDTLSDLTAGAEPADVRGVSGAGEDGSYVYFVANGVLAPGASPGSCSGERKAGQQCNLYVAHAGQISYVATLPRDDSSVWQETEAENPRRKFRELRAGVSPSGRYLALASHAPLTAYDNLDPATGSRRAELYRYDALGGGGAGQLACVSCRPSGEPPSGDVEVTFAGNYGPTARGGGASWASNVVLDDGTVFFSTPEPLVPADVNRWEDVYEYRDGKASLISSGTFTGTSRFLAATASGSDVFFLTPEPLLPGDGDGQNASVYDARVGGGFPLPPSAEPGCEGEGCRGELSVPPLEPLPVTAGIAPVPGPHKPRCRRPRRGERRQRATARRPCRQAKGSARKRGRAGR